jgi:hypothetical protein
MLDPWTALSLAASVVQFIDFATNLLAEAKEIRAEGSSKETLNIEKATKRSLIP